MLGDINLRIKEKLKHRTKKMIFSAVLVIAFIAIGINTYNKVEKINYDIQRKNQIQYENIRKKTEILNMALYDLKSSDKFIKYLVDISDNKNSLAPYNRVLLFQDLRKKNNIYGKVGCAVSVTDSSTNFVIGPYGTVDKKSFYKELDFPYNVERRKRYINDNKGNINIFFQDTAVSGEEVISWIVSFDKKDFFAELTSEADNWYIANKETLINIGNNNKKRDEIEKKVQELLKNNINEVISMNEKENNLRIVGKKVHIFYEPSFDFIILYLQPITNIPMIFIYEATKVFFVLGLAYGLFLMIVSFIVKPMKQLAKRMGYISNKDEKELEYIEHKIEEISNINEALQNRISSLRSYQRKKKIKDYLIGISENADISLLREESDIFKVKNYRVMIMEIYDIESVENIFDKFNLSKDLIMKYFSEEVACEVIDIDYKSIAFVMEELLTKEDLEEVLNCLVRHIERNFGLKFTVAVSNVYDETEDMPKAYRAAKKILDYKYIFKQERVLFQERIKENSFNKYYYPIELESKLILRTLSSNEISVKRIIEEMFDEKNSQSMDKKYIKELGMLLYNTLSRIFIQLKDVNENIDVKDYNINEILEISDAVKLKEVFQNKILSICKLTKIEEENDVESVKIKIERYLEENYMIDISLENLADHLGHSFKYTSVLFKKVMGDNFKNYLSIYRIEKAKELMQENHDLKIKDLAELIGYNSSNTFIRIFRKYEGVSPGKYFEIVD